MANAAEMYAYECSTQISAVLHTLALLAFEKGVHSRGGRSTRSLVEQETYHLLRMHKICCGTISHAYDCNFGELDAMEPLDHHHHLFQRESNACIFFYIFFNMIRTTLSAP